MIRRCTDIRGLVFNQIPGDVKKQASMYDLNSGEKKVNSKQNRIEPVVTHTYVIDWLLLLLNGLYFSEQF